MTKLLSLLAILFLGRKEEVSAPRSESVMLELAEADRREATAVMFRKRRR